MIDSIFYLFTNIRSSVNYSHLLSIITVGFLLKKLLYICEEIGSVFSDLSGKHLSKKSIISERNDQKTLKLGKIKSKYTTGIYHSEKNLMKRNQQIL